MSAWMQHAIRYVQAAGRRTDSAGGAATCSAILALAEQVGRLADVAEAWQKAQEDHTSVTEWGSLEPVAVRPPQGQR